MSPLRGAAVGLLLVACGTVAGAAAGDDGVELRILAMLANNTTARIDPRLDAMERQLRSLFSYRSYRLVKRERRRVGWGSRASFHIPGGHRVQILPKACRNDQVSMRLVLLEGPHPVLNTDLTLPNRGHFLVGGRARRKGILIIWIGAEAR